MNEWSSEVGYWEVTKGERKVVKAGVGMLMGGRGVVNKKGREAACRAALHAIRGENEKMQVNLVMIAEGEEEIGSPHIAQLVHRPDVEAALRGRDASSGMDG